MRRALLALLLAASPLTLFAQKKEITLDAIYDPATRVYFSGAVQSGFEWLDEQRFIWPEKNEKGDVVAWQLFDVSTGKRKPLYDRARLQAALRSAGLPESAAASRKVTFNDRGTALLVVAAADLYLYTLDRNTATRLTSTPAEEEEATFSPDGRRVAFVRDHNLFVVDVDTQRERQLTTDGSAQILNGKLDWVYQEEIYGRGHYRAYWWSPDSSRLAFLQLDESRVPRFTVVDHIPYHLNVDVYPYPKAGDPNPRVKLFVVPANGGDATMVDNERYAPHDILIVNVAWSADGSSVAYQVQNREQTWLDLNFADPAKGTSRRVLRETTPAWVNENGSPKWLDDGSFLWLSERDGWRHIYHYDSEGALVRQVTRGEWEVRDLHGVDSKERVVYFSGTERSHIGRDVYRIGLDGEGLQRLSQSAGTHNATFSPALAHYVDSWSDIRTPPQIRVHRSDGRTRHLVHENRVAALDEFDLLPLEFLQVKTRDGFVMEAILIRPPGFDPSKKYPVYQPLYGGPHAPRVRNAWQGNSMLLNQVIARQGVIVWLCDNRTASGKGAVSTWPVYKNFGELELRDIEDGIAWLKQQPGVDGSRVMLNGWSYGGFMVAYALTHSKTFAAGVAGGTVADWRDYDTIYTERYMLMPQNNPEGYRKSSPRFAAGELHGRLLLMHGTMDDNVHLQNALQFAWELQKAGKEFEMMLYPKSRHGISDPALQLHMQRTVLDFVRRNLLEQR